VSKKETEKKPVTSSKFGTIGNLQKDEEQDSSDEEGNCNF